MAIYREFPETDSRHQTTFVRDQFNQMAMRLRDEIEYIDDPQAKALFETSAEVLDGLAKAFLHYEARSEPAWRVEQR